MSSQIQDIDFDQSYVIKKSLLHVSTTKRFYFTRRFTPLLLYEYISNISNLYNLDKNLSLASQMICDHMFSDSKSDHIFRIFGYVPGLYIFLLVCCLTILPPVVGWDIIGYESDPLPSYNDIRN